MTCCSSRQGAKANASPFGKASWDKAPGDDLLLHGLSHTTIGAAAFHFRVRDGIGWGHSAKVARERVRVALSRGLGMGTWDVTLRFAAAVRPLVEARYPLHSQEALLFSGSVTKDGHFCFSQRDLRISTSNLELYDQAARIISIS